ncbi:glycoside hydrolase family 38 C-terminal domain-containing protein [Paenibacillus wynnii]|uniref:Alpha-mannosidase n=1 Tax=Paenibacillus wynnii TaxID=268407 RepID=A0A098M895_9BACL|nr:glycoside hydrolase family 38 C-terminal domain-containing protein [Paenibacillus wynnii]KGE18760.1 alpha-mannosidase [Paenibacillus wynnii]
MTKQKYWVVGNTHIDLAWKKTRYEMEEVFDSFLIKVLDMLDSHPTFTYTIEQAAHYRLLKERRPDLLARVKHYVQAGRIEMVGGMASTLETNFPNGECFVRNQLIGLRWVEENLGVNVETPWLIDTFGINAQIPQILKQFGYSRLMANRFGGQINDDVFISKGIDGTELLIVGMDVYSPYVKHGQLYWGFVNDWNDVDKLFEKAAKHEGEGPILITAQTENEMLITLRPDYHVKQGNAYGQDGLWQYSTYSKFFDALEATNTSWPVINGDLNPEFTGTFSQRIAIRLRNREVETKVLQAEKWASLTQMTQWQEHLDEAWWELAYIQFHDVFTGSHPTEVFTGLMKSLDSVEKIAQDVIRRALYQPRSRTTTLTGKSAIQVFNSLPWKRRDVVVIPLDKQLTGVKQVLSNGTIVPFDLKEGQLRLLAETPPMGSSILTLEYGVTDEERGIKVDEGMIENEYIRLECDSKYMIKRLVWKETGTTLIENVGDLLSVQRDKGSFQIEELVGEPIPANISTIEITQYEATLLGQRLVLKGEFPELPEVGAKGFLTWEAEFELIQGKPALDVKFNLNWQGEGSRLRFNLPTKLDSSIGIYEIPFGTVHRKSYRVRGTAQGEWPAHRFVAIEDQHHGIALINTGAAGVEVSSGTMSTTILRAPQTEYAGMVIDKTSSQHGNHSFDFVIVPYSGTWSDASVLQLAQETNEKLTSMVYHQEIPEQAAITSWMSLSPSNVVLSAVKTPETGTDGMLIRVYESAGITTKAELWVKGAKQAWKSNLREEKTEDALSFIDGKIVLELQPFEILTLYILR